MSELPVASNDFGSLDELDLSEFRIELKRQFDLVIIGSGPAGQKAALTAALEGARVALVEKDPLAGGVCLNTGTIPSKSLREAVLYLTGYRQRGYYGEDYHLKEQVCTGDLIARTNHVIKLERQEINDQLEQLGVVRLVGRARLVGPHEVLIDGGGVESRITSESILLAVGTRPRRPPDVPFDDLNVFDSDDVFGRENELRPLPDSIIVMGAGVIGIEYASMFAALKIPTILVDPREAPLSFVDECVASLLYRHLRKSGVQLLFGDLYDQIDVRGAGTHERRVSVKMRSGQTVEADSLLFALGRNPATDGLGLEEIGVELDKRGYVKVDDGYRSSIPSILAAGDVVGFPSLASTSAEQGRIAAHTALKRPVTWHPDSIPYGIYTIPEISMVGRTEQQCLEEGTKFFLGTALWRDTARGKIIGDLSGALKLIFRREDKRLIGVHIIGEGATELLHIGQAVMHFGGGPEYFLNNVFNYPTLAEAYKLAAHNAIQRLEGKTARTESLLDQIESNQLPVEYISWK
jgi:NAD(P) transhydrogenase